MAPHFELNRLADRSDAALLEELRRVASLIEAEFLSKKAFDTHSKVSADTLRKRFGSWEKALTAAGLSHLFNGCGLTDKIRKQCGRFMSEADVIAELRRVADELGTQTIKQDDFNCYASIEAGTVRKRFGSWNNALRAAGLSVTPLGRRYTDDQCFENLLTVWTHYGRPPMHREMKSSPSIVGPKAYILRWGTWNKALQAFVDRVNSDETAISEITSQTTVEEPAAMKTATKRRAAEADVRDIRIGLRYSVLKRDSFKCVLCGASPATKQGCILHVDHIIAWSRGGKTVLTNLRALCERCNIGKGAQLE